MPVLILAAAAAAAPVANIAPARTFGSWTVACDNLRQCAGVSVNDSQQGGEGAEQPWVILFKRRAAGNAPVVVEAFPTFMDTPPGPVTFRIDGKASGFDVGDSGSVKGDGARLLSAIANAKKIQVMSRSGRQVGVVAASGASAALRWIDDQQRRVGTVTAIVAKGAKPLAAVPPPPNAPRIAVPPTAKAAPVRLAKGQEAKVKKLSDYCDNAGEGPDVATETFRLDSKTTLAIVPCGLGAYQSNSVIIVLDNAGKWTPAIIEQPSAPEREAAAIDTSILTEAMYDPASRLLSSTAKGRGLGDCGMGATWAWDGRMFRLTGYDDLDACAGAPPGTWLPRWHTANDPLDD